MLIAISGSQGSGKSTVLKELRLLGYNTVERKTARSVLTEWGTSLEEVYSDPLLTMRFQDEILNRKKQDEQLATLDPGLWFTERTYADVFTYTLIYLGKDNQYSDWLNEYYADCMRAQQTYDLVFYLRAGQFDVCHDGVRGSNAHYSRMADLTMLDTTHNMTHPSALAIVDTANLRQRVDRIICVSQRLLHK